MRRLLTYVVVNGERFAPASASIASNAEDGGPGSTSAQGAARRGRKIRIPRCAMKALESLFGIRRRMMTSPGLCLPWSMTQSGASCEAVNVLWVLWHRGGYR